MSNITLRLLTSLLNLYIGLYNLSIENFFSVFCMVQYKIKRKKKKIVICKNIFKVQIRAPRNRLIYIYCKTSDIYIIRKIIG